jgi:hypothetical protein
MDEMVNKAFNNLMKIQKASDDAFRMSMANKEETASYIAFYMDEKLKKSSKGRYSDMPEAEIEASMKINISIFVLLESRD